MAIHPVHRPIPRFCFFFCPIPLSGPSNDNCCQQTTSNKTPGYSYQPPSGIFGRCPACLHFAYSYVRAAMPSGPCDALTQHSLLGDSGPRSGGEWWATANKHASRRDVGGKFSTTAPDKGNPGTGDLRSCGAALDSMHSAKGTITGHIGAHLLSLAWAVLGHLIADHAPVRLEPGRRRPLSRFVIRDIACSIRWRERGSLRSQSSASFCQRLRRQRASRPPGDTATALGEAGHRNEVWQRNFRDMAPRHLAHQL